MPHDLKPVLAELDAQNDAAVQRLCDLLRIPSISTDPAFNADTRRAAEWLAADLRTIGFKADVRETAGHPMVMGHHEPPGTPASAPCVLYYGHYDVQPPDPLEKWTSPPFEPAVVDGPHGKRIVARGAVDDKGQVMTFIEAFRAWKNVHGSLPMRIKIMLEGEEESGSPSLDPFLAANRSELQADVCVISDTGMWDIKTPAVTYMLRGLVYVELTLRGPSHDLHSGGYGGVLNNPINALVDVLARLHDKDGRITLPGFYDDVLETGADEKRMWESLGFDERAFLAGAGMRTPFGEKGRTTLERVWSRPTCDINGISGGYTGRGAKTVIACEASAKVSFRLVPNQDPAKILNALRAWLKDNTPADCTWTVHEHGASPAIRVPTDSPWLTKTRAALQEVFGKPAVLIGSGGSIPVAGSIRRILGFDSLLVGFGLDDDRVHSPNEKFEVRCFEMGMKSQAAMLARFANVHS